MSAVELELGPAVPAWAVRVLPAAAAAAAVALAAPPGLAWWARGLWLVASAVLVAGAPGAGAAGGVLLTTGLALLAGPVDEWRTALLVLLLHAVVVLAPLAAHVPWRARVEAAVLVGLARGAAPAQLVAQLLALAVLPAAGAFGESPWLRVLALAATVGLALLTRGGRAGRKSPGRG